MLAELQISNFAIIDKLSVSFKPGLTVVTGETGAGKSILVNAINLLLGSRSSGDLIRTGSQEAAVTVLFHHQLTPASLRPPQPKAQASAHGGSLG